MWMLSIQGKYCTVQNITYWTGLSYRIKRRGGYHIVVRLVIILSLTFYISRLLFVISRYGFLSENSNFAAACEEAGIAFVGPTVANLERFSDKTTARQAAIDAGVPVVPGSDGPIENAEDIVKFVEGIGLPVIIKVCIVALYWTIHHHAQRNSTHTLSRFHLFIIIGCHGWRWKGYACRSQHGRPRSLFRIRCE
jgi:hypothetical protein